MGSEQSHASDSRRPPDHGGTPKTCYYEVLGIARQATEDDIKKAYRQKALELHPDRNFGNVEDATRQFAEVQSAYQLLSDPHERAWYDAHREQILSGVGAGEGAHYEHNTKVTSNQELVGLMGRFSTNIPFTDAPNGFYGVLRSTFQKLADEEAAACEWADIDPIDWPDFGEKDDDYEDVVRPFYAKWAAFTTQKTFSWKELYNLNEASDRRIRRLMEQDNAKARDIGRREFNAAVQELLLFVKKRDPRHLQNMVSAEERQRQLREAACAQAARARAVNQANLAAQEVPAWARKPASEVDVGSFSDSDVSEEHVFECVACGKIFKSEQQYSAHEKSKKHIKIVQHLRRQMEKENDRLNLDSDSASAIISDEHVKDVDERPVSAHQREELPQHETPQPGYVFIEDVVNEPISSQYTELSNDDRSSAGDNNTCGSDTTTATDTHDDPIWQQARSQGNSETHENKQAISGDEDNIDISMDAISIVELQCASESIPKLGKAKAKRAKRAMRDEAGEHKTTGTQAEDILCITCGQGFSSRNDLFQHIKDNPRHAQPMSSQDKRKPKGKARNR